MKQIIFWGATGHAKVLREAVGHHGYELVAVFDNNRDVHPPFPDVPLHYGVEGFKAWLREHGFSETEALVTIGGASGRDRLEIQNFLKRNGVRPATVIHPTAFVAKNATIEEGSQIIANATVGVETEVGKACIINTAASVDHESVLEDGVHIAPGAVLAGSVRVGSHTLVGVGAVVLPWIKIGSDVTIGAGAVVTKDVPDGVVAYGNPAKIQTDKD